MELAITEDGRRHLDYFEALRLLTELVAEKGDDFVYVPPEFVDMVDNDMMTACSYAVETPDGLAPSCGVGEVLFRLDPAYLTVAHTYDPGVHGRFSGTSAASLLRDVLIMEGPGLITSARANTLLHTFQYYQDKGTPYGDALREAIASALHS